jgi:hypothetical protein
MRRVLTAGLAALVATAAIAAAPPPKKKAAPKPPVTKTDPVPLACPESLGQGVKSGRRFCEVYVGRVPANGFLLHLPKHKGTAILRFNLHNRQMVSPSQVQSGRAYTRATATIGALAPDGTLLGRGVVQTEFRGESDLFDRVGGGAGPGGLKAVAPIGNELISIEVPEKVNDVSLLGEKLVVTQMEGQQTFTAEGRPIAVVSNAQVEYQPAPIKPPPKKKRR